MNESFKSNVLRAAVAMPFLLAMARDGRDPEVELARALERLPGCRVIWGDDGTPYLLRIYLVRCFRKHLPGIFLHYFFRGDNDRGLHNHPWERARSLILTGGYVEERRRADGRIERKTFLPGSWNVLNKDDFHRVDLIARGCWTLFIAGRRFQDWGFSDGPGHFEHHEDREVRLRHERAHGEEANQGHEEDDDSSEAQA